MNRMLDGWVSSVVMLRLGKSLGGGRVPVTDVGGGSGRGWSRTWAGAQGGSRCGCGRGSGRGWSQTWAGLRAGRAPHRNMVCTLTMVFASAM